RLLRELPGIFLWAVEGWARLQKQGRFTEPEAAEEMRQVIADLGSPVMAFVRDRCDLGDGFQVERAKLYAGWRCYCDDEGRRDSGNATFGKDLRAALPNIREKKCGSDKEGRVWQYFGLRLKPEYDSDPFASSVQ